MSRIAQEVDYVDLTPLECSCKGRIPLDVELVAGSKGRTVWIPATKTDRSGPESISFSAKQDTSSWRSEQGAG